MKRLLISHFFNEEYLLPWWLKHHREIFDHGVLIDYRSTDASVEICRELVPGWEIVTSEHLTFSGIMCDFEVMKHEERFENCWKLVLNTTEFLVGRQIDNVTHFLMEREFNGGRIPGAVMVDTDPDTIADPALPLVAQKSMGAWETDVPFYELNFDWYREPSRTRTLHNYKIGSYRPGRHASNLPGLVNIKPRDLGIWWYAFSPWGPEAIARKLQIKTKMDPMDRKVGFGRQHLALAQDLNDRHAALLPYARNLIYA